MTEVENDMNISETRILDAEKWRGEGKHHTPRRNQLGMLLEDFRPVPVLVVVVAVPMVVVVLLLSRTLTLTLMYPGGRYAIGLGPSPCPSTIFTSVRTSRIRDFGVKPATLKGWTSTTY